MSKPTKNLGNIVDEFVRKGLIEDRIEYSVEDFQKAYDLNEQEAKNLQWLVRTELRQPKPRTSLELEVAFSVLQDADIGKYLKEYLVESNHEGWDAWDSRDKTGAKRLLADLYLYIMNAK
jgi:hypothetical protein